MSCSHTCSPYGAYELKRLYRRNLLIGYAVTTVLFGVSAAATAVFFHDAPPVRVVETPPGPSGNRIADFRVTRDQPEIQVRSVSSPQVSQKGYRPVGVPDDLVPDGFDPATPTDDWSLRSGTGEDIGWNPRAGGGDAAGVFKPAEPDYPPPDSFIPLEIQPQLVTCVKPDYPRRMIDAGLEGTVWVQALVDIDGRVLEAIVARSSGVELLDEAAREASYKNTFSPGIQNGIPVRVWVTYRVEFNLADRRH